MKINTAVAVVVFSSFLQIVLAQRSLSTQSDAVSQEINVVNRVVTKMREFQYGLFPQVFGFIGIGQSNMSEVINLHYNETIDHVEEWVRNSTAEGKDPSACKATAISSFQSLRVNGTRAFETCLDIVRDWLHSVEDALEANIQEALKISSFLYSIFPSCYTTDVEEIESCIDQNIPNATQIVEMYRTTTSTYLSEIHSSYESAQNRMINCLTAVEPAAEEEWDDVKGDFALCVMTL